MLQLSAENSLQRVPRKRVQVKEVNKSFYRTTKMENSDKEETSSESPDDEIDNEVWPA